jgi:hypothetical protein
MNFKSWLLEGQTPVFFVRTTRSPENDIKRSWSCHAEGWVDSKEEAYEHWEIMKKKFGPNVREPRQDLQYHGINPDGTKFERWCVMVEPGLSGFAFWDENSFRRAKVKMEKYVDSFGPNQKLAIFESDKFKMKSGSDREDTFLPGVFLGWVKYTDSFDVVLALKTSS